MGPHLAERRLHGIRWVLTTGWLLIIASLLHDPWTAALSRIDQPWNPFRLSPDCIDVQGRCVVDAPAPLGATLFWGAIVPAGVLVLLVFGHELWRRICPLSFLSQIPRALGIERHIRRTHPRTGKVSEQLAKVPPDSWLARHYSQVQFSWLFLGLCGRILFFNADRLLLAAWLLLTIAAAIFVGWYYGGKSWCQYFCPMAPVQSIYSTPAGLLGSKAHMDSGTITQSMCRTVEADGSERSACVACQQPCIDIDAERLYWARLPNRDFSFERYGYVGLVVGYFLYYYLYAGSWSYYFSGFWARDPQQLATLFSPGFYLAGQPIAVPRLLAVPLTLGLCTWGGWLAGRALETGWHRRLQRRGRTVDPLQVRHRVFVLATYAVVNGFFLFAGRPLLQQGPLWLQGGFDVLIVATSTLWMVRAWRRSPALYGRENLAGRFRRQLQRLELEGDLHLDGRSLDDLSPDELYVLAKVLPDFTRQKRLEAYKGVVREALEEGYVNGSSSLAVLAQLRRELDIGEEMHQQVLDALGVEDPGLLDPDQRRSLEDQIRLSGYRKSLERLLLLQQRPAARSGGRQASDLEALALEFTITPQERDAVLAGLTAEGEARRRIPWLVERCDLLVRLEAALERVAVEAGEPLVVGVLQERLRDRQGLLVEAAQPLLRQEPQDSEAASALIGALQRLPRKLLSESLRSRPGQAPIEAPPERSEALRDLETWLQDRNPIAAAAALFLLCRLDTPRGLSLARTCGGSGGNGTSELLVATARQLLAWGEDPQREASAAAAAPPLAAFPALEKLLVLAGSDVFGRCATPTLEALAERSEIRGFAAGAVITEAGDTCRELLLLIEGAATALHVLEDEQWSQPLRRGQALDELDVLSHAAAESTIVAEATPTRLLAVPVEAFDSLLDRDPDFARRVLELESRQMRRLTAGVQRSSGES
ncbi:MAG: cyclic nucleotide-binding domain-containing protein [Synechococcus sp.]